MPCPGRHQARRVADQRGARGAHRRPGAAPSTARRPDRGRRARHVPRGTPAADSPFYDLPNVIVTPHTAWSSGRVLDRSVELFCENLVRYAAGQPLQNVVDPGAGTERSGRTLQRADADRHRRPCLFRQDDRLQHADPRPRRDGRIRRHAAQCRRGQGARRAADAAGGDLQAQEGRPGRRHLRRSAGAARRRPRARSAPRSCPPSTSPASATPTHCCTLSVRSRILRCPHPEGSVDPWRDLERLDLEFILADLAVAERRLERLRTQGRHGTPAEREANERELVDPRAPVRRR